ncbi:MAG: winged helix-turn-helix transcriptional regulator [Kofleriaceae bacterium]
MKSRSYEDPCGVARALDRIGERWALLVVRELLLGPKRFADLVAGLAEISPNVLSQRLDELVASKVVAQRQLPPPSRTWVYELTPWGHELEAVLLAIARWGSRAQPLPRGELSIDALLLALRTTLDLERTRGKPFDLELRIAGEHYRVRLAGSTLHVSRGSVEDPDASLTTDATTLRKLVFGDLTLAVARRRTLIEIEGDARAAARFLGAFRRPTEKL